MGNRNLSPVIVFTELSTAMQIFLVFKSEDALTQLLLNRAELIVVLKYVSETECS
jgi:hypothetical protein